MNNKIISIVIGTIVIGGVSAWYLVGRNEESATPSVTARPEEVVVTYKDGTHRASGAYFSPAGAEEVEIFVTLKSGIITNIDFVGKATNPGSVMAQTKFSEGFREQVVGKAINEVSLTVVNGSSLTPKGFMDALRKIEVQARA